MVGVEKSYGRVAALRGVDLEVGRGEIVGLVGPNGAGKTSLVSIVAGLRRPDKGTVTVDGLDVAHHRDRVGAHLGLAPQDLAIYPTLRVRDNLVAFGELAGLRGRALRERLAETADALGLGDLLDRRAAALSGGQKRRLHTAMALIHRPPLLLLDEPTTGADVESRNQLLALVRSLADAGAAVCYSSHYLPEVEQLRASIVILDQGQVVARGPLDTLLGAHARAVVALVFDGPAPTLAIEGAVADGDRLRLPSDDPASTAARALAMLNGAAEHLVGVEIVRPTLESVYLAVTGRRYDAGGQASAAGEVSDVAVA
ncbi:MAG TPA: ABC transporter ATP-binding protein [Acidimicrobiales bacterium]|nr:ABC transporter ATP-binding protein [Acidimicrobiales bacterium]